MGPNWRREQWLRAASAVGMRIGRPHRFTHAPAHPDGGADGAGPVTVTVAGGRCVGPVAGALATQARRLAAAAAVELLAVSFSSPDADAAFLDAYLGPDISRDEVADALLENFLARAVPA